MAAYTWIPSPHISLVEDLVQVWARIKSQFQNSRLLTENLLIPDNHPNRRFIPIQRMLRSKPFEPILDGFGETPPLKGGECVSLMKIDLLDL